MFTSGVALAVKKLHWGKYESMNAYFPTSHWIFKDNHVANKGREKPDTFLHAIKCF